MTTGFRTKLLPIDSIYGTDARAEQKTLSSVDRNSLRTLYKIAPLLSELFARKSMGKIRILQAAELLESFVDQAARIP
jgi:hypothetical protein